MQEFPRTVALPARRDEYLHSRHGYRIAVTSWTPSSRIPARARVIFAHGYTNSSGAGFEHLAFIFSSQGFECFGIEHYGSSVEGTRCQHPSGVLPHLSVQGTAGATDFARLFPTSLRKRGARAEHRYAGAPRRCIGASCSVVDDFDDWAHIVKSGRASLASQQSDLPLFTYAESMGGAIAIQVTMCSRTVRLLPS